MAKPTRECSQEEIRTRALLVLDGLTYFQEDIMWNIPKTPIEHFVHDVYMIAHAATGHCKGDHDDWLDLIDERAKQLKEANICNLQKEMLELEGD